MEKQFNQDWDRLAPKTILQLTSEEQVMTRTKLNSKFEQESFTLEAEKLGQSLDRSLVKTFIFLAVLAVGSIAGGVAFIDLTCASNELVETIK